MDCRKILISKGYSHILNSYEVLKVENDSVSFIESEDWNTSREPVVGDSYKVSLDGSIKITNKKNNPQIYHHKWMFVEDNYSGFNVQESKAWSDRWTAVLPSTREIKSRIGYKNYWENILTEYNLL